MHVLNIKNTVVEYYKECFNHKSRSWIGGLLKRGSVESLQSHSILTMSHWSSGLTLCFLSQGTWVQIPWGYLCETGILLLALSCYIGDPDVIDHFCGLVWGRLHPEPSLGPRADNVIIPLDLTAFLSRFHARCRSPFRLHNRRSWLLGGSPVESLQFHSILTMSHWSSGLTLCFPSQGTWVQIPWGVLMWNWVLLLGLSHYSSKHHLSKWVESQPALVNPFLYCYVCAARRTVFYSRCLPLMVLERHLK
jgi:hypothetical protein